MKTATGNKGQQGNKGGSKTMKPQNKDDMDSRKAKVGGKDNTAKMKGGEKVKTKNPGKSAPKKAAAKTGNQTPKGPAKKGAKKAGKKTTTKK
ncbi:MAG: hypothetical protein K0Q95_423 [Bacteroidota bacterium]|jgi:hypothetical protein|nr:hypothetical protein [Bacteroidota bacterium]